MRSLCFIATLLIAAPAPVAAAPSSHSPPPELTDPATVDKLARAMQAMSKAMLDLRVGEMKAALEGRAPSAEEKTLTVRDLGRRDDPAFERNVELQIANARPRIEQSLKAFNNALPAITRSLKQASEAIERAAANMPDPTYPKR